jgi:AcrR family transcriptional regulator
VWARPPEQRRTALTRAAIVAAAITLADADGLAAVSIRKVAAELGARTMSLYSHIDSKEDLLDLMTDEMNAELLVEGALPTDWREAISMIAHRTRENLLRHPWIVELVSRRPRIGPNGLRHGEQSLVAIKPLGLDPRSAARIINAVDDYVTGHTIRELMNRSTRDAAAEEQRQLVLRPYFQQMLESGEFPNLAPLLRQGLQEGAASVENAFEQGLGWLLDGIAAGFAPS